MRDGTPIHWQGIATRREGSPGAGAPPPAARRLTDASTLASASRQDWRHVSNASPLTLSSGT
eukprot:12398714-Karenia_brevis.AAC.1